MRRLVAAWIQEELHKKADVERLLKRLPDGTPKVGADELLTAIRALGDLAKVVARASSERKAKIYAGLGIRLHFHSEKQKIQVTAESQSQSIGDRFVSEGGLALYVHACRHW